MEEYEDLVTATKAFPEAMKKYLMFISKSGFTEPVKRRAEEEGAVLLTADRSFLIWDGAFQKMPRPKFSRFPPMSVYS